MPGRTSRNAHLLIADETGGRKSVLSQRDHRQAILMLLATTRRSPHVMIDPKMVELSGYGTVAAPDGTPVIRT